MAVKEFKPFRTLRAVAAAVSFLASAAVQDAAAVAPKASPVQRAAADPCRAGRGQYASGDVLRAIASLEKCVERTPRNRDAWATLAMARLEAGRFVPSADAFARAHALKAGDATFLAGYLDALEGAGRRSGQIPLLRAMAESSRDARPHALRLLALADSLGAAAHGEERLFALEILAQAPDAELRHQEQLASAYLSLGRHAQAQGEYRGLLARRPDVGEYWAGLASSISGEDRAGALECYRKAILYSNQATSRAAYEERAAALKATESRLASLTPATTAPAPAAKETVPQVAAAPVTTKPSSASVAPKATALHPPGAAAKPFDLKAFQDSVYKAELEKRLAALRRSGQLPSAAAPAVTAAAVTAATPSRAARAEAAREERRDRAVALYKRGSLDSADALFDLVMAESPDPETYFFAGRVDLDKGRPGRALHRFEKAPRDQADLDRFVGKANLRLGNRREALAAFERQYARTGDANVLEDICALRREGPDSLYVACMEALSAKRPHVPEYHAELAAHLARRGDRSRALERYVRILTLEPGHGEANLYLGLDWSSQGAHDRAVPLLVKAVAALPEHGPAWKALAKGQSALGHKDEARASWTRAARLLPRDVETARGRLASLRDAAAFTEAGSGAELEGAYLALLKLAPEDRDAALGYARLRFQARDWPAAEKHFRIGCQESRDAEAWGQFGRALLELGRRDEAAEALQKAVDLGETGRGLRLDLARIHLEKGDADRAEALMKRLSAEAPSDPAPYHGLALVAARRHQSAAQEEHLRKANRLKPDNPVYAADLAGLFRERGACPQALTVLAPAEKFLDAAGRSLQADCLAETGEGARALKIYSQLFRQRPSGDLLARQIDVLVRMGRAAEALDAGRGTAFADHPAVRFSLAKAHLALSESLVLKADLDQAVSLLQGALDDEPHRAEYHLALGSTYAAQRRWKKAMGAYTDALKYRVNYPEAVLGKGRCLIKLGRQGKARDFFNELSQHADPQWRAKGLLGLAQVFEAEGKWEAVEHHLGRAVAAYPDPDAMAYLSRVHLRLGRFPEAEDWAGKAIALDSSHEAGNLAMADVLAARKKVPEALGLASAVLKLKPLSCNLLVQSAKLNLEAGRVDSTLETTSKAMQACPQEPLPHFYAGMAHRSAKRMEEARRHFKTFTRLGGDRKLVPE